jgi:hypothetical protein
MQSGTLRLHDNLPSDSSQSLLHENVRKKTTFSPIAAPRHQRGEIVEAAQSHLDQSTNLSA